VVPIHCRTEVCSIGTMELWVKIGTTPQFVAIWMPPGLVKLLDRLPGACHRSAILLFLPPRPTTTACFVCLQVRISASHGKLVQWAIRHGHQLDLLSLYCCKSSSGAVEHVLIMRSCLNDFVRSCLLPSELFVRLLNLQIKTATLPSTCKDGTSTSHPKWCQMSQVAFYNVLAES
jgi:hypothetical protein